ncbi:hypothetical protein [Bradyrhizobium sp. th.b2]|uniref:hypothetical protein n=1 Tax=Bradyrhizobium sp. th-b2 TaxID=172088 RepID=UPI0004194896|nr:hypothetical protein [Bradyrhizobium sp. th.b2]
MESTVVADFDTRRAAELAAEYVVQERGVPRGDIFVQPTGAANTAGDRPAGADAKAAPAPEQSGKLKGPIKGSLDLQGDDPKCVADALKDAGAKAVRTK